MSIIKFSGDKMDIIRESQKRFEKSLKLFQIIGVAMQYICFVAFSLVLIFKLGGIISDAEAKKSLLILVPLALVGYIIDDIRSMYRITIPASIVITAWFWVRFRIKLTSLQDLNTVMVAFVHCKLSYSKLYYKCQELFDLTFGYPKVSGIFGE